MGRAEGLPGHRAVLGQHSPARAGRTGATGLQLLQGKTTLTPLPHILSEAQLDLGFGWIKESVSLKQKEHARVFSGGDKVGFEGKVVFSPRFLYLVGCPPLRPYSPRI